MPSFPDARTAQPIDKHVGSRVRMRRLLIGMSQEKLAEALGIAFQQVQKYEKGTNRIGASRLYRMAQLLGVEVAYFFEELPEYSDAPRPRLEFLQSAEGTKLVQALLRIHDPGMRRAALAAAAASLDTFADALGGAGEPQKRRRGRPRRQPSEL